MITFEGIGASSGVAAGPLCFYRREVIEIPRGGAADAEMEWRRFKTAQAEAIRQLGELVERARTEAGEEGALLFRTHCLMAEDLDCEEAVSQAIREDAKSAEEAVADVGARFTALFAAMDDVYMRARAADVKDVSNRILAILTGAARGGVDSDIPVILAADDLSPSETVQFDKGRVLAFLTEGGSAASHTAILARMMGIPAVVGVGGRLRAEYAGRETIVDGGTGRAVIEPDAATRTRLLGKRADRRTACGKD